MTTQANATKLYQAKDLVNAGVPVPMKVDRWEDGDGGYWQNVHYLGETVASHVRVKEATDAILKIARERAENLEVDYTPSEATVVSSLQQMLFQADEEKRVVAIDRDKWKAMVEKGEPSEPIKKQMREEQEVIDALRKENVELGNKVQSLTEERNEYARLLEEAKRKLKEATQIQTKTEEVSEFKRYWYRMTQTQREKYILDRIDLEGVILKIFYGGHAKPVHRSNFNRWAKWLRNHERLTGHHRTQAARILALFYGPEE